MGGRRPFRRSVCDHPRLRVGAGVEVEVAADRVGKGGTPPPGPPAIAIGKEGARRKARAFSPAKQSHHASMQGRLRYVRSSGFGTERRPDMIQWRVAAGSITSSI